VAYQRCTHHVRERAIHGFRSILILTSNRAANDGFSGTWLRVWDDVNKPTGDGLTAPWTPPTGGADGLAVFSCFPGFPTFKRKSKRPPWEVWKSVNCSICPLPVAMTVVGHQTVVKNSNRDEISTYLLAGRWDVSLRVCGHALKPPLVRRLRS